MYERSKLIRFAHCDPAGIVFYPRYVELCNEVVEDWFADGLGVSFEELHQRRHLGVPAVRLEVAFVAPSRIGDVLSFQLRVLELGRTSASLRIDARCGGEERVRFDLKIVQIDLGTGRPIPWDEDWRARLRPYLAAPAVPEPAR
jgi:4-hydroxybenzoyl-CoA thioesterase